MKYFGDGIHSSTLGEEAKVKKMITQLGLRVRNVRHGSLEKEIGRSSLSRYVGERIRDDQ